MSKKINIAINPNFTISLKIMTNFSTNYDRMTAYKF